MTKLDDLDSVAIQLPYMGNRIVMDNIHWISFFPTKGQVEQCLWLYTTRWIKADFVVDREDGVVDGSALVALEGKLKGFNVFDKIENLTVERTFAKLF